MEAHSLSTVDSSLLLTKEQEELNAWTRTSLQIYYAWYSVFLTVNGAGLAWLFERKGAGVAFIIFAFWNLLGIVASLAVYQYVGESNKRVIAIYEHLLGSKGRIEPRHRKTNKRLQ